MLSRFENILRNSGKWLLMVTLFMPLIVVTSLPYPYAFSKATFLFFLAEVLLGIIVLLFFVNTKKENNNKKSYWEYLKNPITITFGLFFISYLVSAIFAVNKYRAFWGIIERNEGVFGMIHYAVLFLAFLIFFNKKDWKKYLKGSVLVGVVVSIFAIFQFIGIKTFSFIYPYPRPGSFIGNATFLATYLIFLLGISLVLASGKLLKQKISKIWRTIFWLSSILFILTIFITQTRGAILALLGGIFFVGVIYSLISKNKKIKYSVLALILIGIVGVSGIWMTKEADIWQKVPGLNRMVQISSDSPTLRTRILSLQSSWGAFKEKPILGWGPENFNIAYNKYYNPEFGRYEKSWFDRAHNKIADVAVMQGSVGITIYILLWLSILYYLFKSILFRKKNGHNIHQPVIILGTWIVYFVQNLFVFDQIVSNLFFVTLLSLTILDYFDSRNSIIEENFSDENYKNQNIIPMIVLALFVFCGLIYSLYNWVLIPFKQGYEYKKIEEMRNGEKILEATNKFFEPYNYSQLTIRFMFMQFLHDNALFARAEFEPLTNASIKSMEEVIDKEPYDPRNYLLLAEVYTEKSKINQDFADEALYYIEKGLEFSPNRQTLLYQKAFDLAVKGRIDEALNEIEETIALDDKVYRAHYYHALILAVAADYPGYESLKQEYREKSQEELDLAREEGINILNETDLNNMIALYKAWGQYEKLAEIFERLIVIHPRDSYYTSAINGRVFLQDKEGVIKNAGAYARFNPEKKDEMDVIIDLAEKERWDLLNSL